MPRQAAQPEQDLSELEQMMGLDDMGEMEIPAHLMGVGAGGGGGGPGMSEDDMIAAAI